MSWTEPPVFGGQLPAGILGSAGGRGGRATCIRRSVTSRYPWHVLYLIHGDASIASTRRTPDLDNTQLLSGRWGRKWNRCGFASGQQSVVVEVIREALLGRKRLHTALDRAREVIGRTSALLDSDHALVCTGPDPEHDLSPNAPHHRGSAEVHSFTRNFAEQWSCGQLRVVGNENQKVRRSPSSVGCRRRT